MRCSSPQRQPICSVIDFVPMRSTVRPSSTSSPMRLMAVNSHCRLTVGMPVRRWPSSSA